ncbi:hypothetical protein L218DRAFT_960697, partial [Marasmius fiardii PR-910]
YKTVTLPDANSLPLLCHCIPFIFLSPFSCTLWISPDFLTNTVCPYTTKSLIACALLQDFVHLVSNPPQMLGSILCRVECCWQREKLVSPRVNGEFHTIH